MSATESPRLLPSDLVVRYDRESNAVTFLTVSGRTGEVSRSAIHEVTVDPTKGIEGVLDVGAAVCAHLFVSSGGRFCSDDEWERLAEDIRKATGRDSED